MKDKNKTTKDLKIEALEIELKKAKLLLDQYKGDASFNLNTAHSTLKDLGEDKYMASGLLLEIKNISGETKVKVLINDGFKIETIKALQDEVKKTAKLNYAWLKGLVE